MEKPKGKWKSIIKRTVIIWAILSGLLLTIGNLRIKEHLDSLVLLLLISVFVAFVLEGISGSIQKKRQARRLKQKDVDRSPPKGTPSVKSKAIYGVNSKQSETFLLGPIPRDPRNLFAQYNPLYFFSALCVLSGMLLISLALGKADWKQGQILLTAVIQSYEIMLIIGGAILFRRAGLYRPAVILCLLEVFFLFDCTFRTEVMFTFGRAGVFLIIGWMTMVALKVAVLKWMFRLKFSAMTIVVPALVAVGVAGIPHLLGLESIPKGTTHMIATWYGAGILACALWLHPKISCAVSLDEWGQTVLSRSVKGAMIVWAGFFLFHLFTWIVLFSLPITLAQLVPFYLLWFFSRKREIWKWGGGLGAIAATSAEPSVVAPIALVVGIVFVLQAWHTRRYRLFVGGVLSFYFACWTIGWQGWPLPEPNLLLNAVTALILALMAWRMRLLSTIPAIVLVMLPGAEKLIPHGPLQWGILIFVIGLIALIIGIAINLSQKKSHQ